MQRVQHWYPKVRGEVSCLIEPALTAARWMQRYRNDKGDTVEKWLSPRPHQRSERARQRSAAVVLERMEKGAEGSFIGPDGAGAIDGTVDSTAPHAGADIGRQRAPRRKRISARITDGRGNRHNGRPASGTNDASGWVFERFAACGAGGREKDRRQRIHYEPRYGR